MPDNYEVCGGYRCWPPHTRSWGIPQQDSDQHQYFTRLHEASEQWASIWRAPRMHFIYGFHLDCVSIYHM